MKKIEQFNAYMFWTTKIRKEQQRFTDTSVGLKKTKEISLTIVIALLHCI